jgi:hypothetical protein
MKFVKVFCILLLLSAAGIILEGAETHNLIPGSCIAVTTVTNIQSDPGMSWLMNSWISGPRESPLREFLRSTSFEEMSVAVFPPKGDYPLYLLVVLNISKGAGIDKTKLNNVITNKSDIPVKSISHKGSTIYFAEGENVPEDFSAYTVLKNKVLLGTDTDIIKSAISGPSVEGSAGYKKAKEWFSLADEGILFADNSSAKFVNFLQPLEKKWKMTLFLSAEDLEWVGFTFDIVDSNRINGEFTFQGSPDAFIEDIQDDAEFLGEAFKRKFIAEKIDYSGTVEVMETTVRLNFQVQGVEPLWKELYKEGPLSVITPGD